jgi:8-oxo-dGTP pyrophosphatase MutT (NUDIX family)
LRRPEEVFVVVYRRGPAEPEFLVLKRSPERQGYWHVVAGALDHGEDAPAAAARELREETGLEAPVVDLDRRYLYALDDEPPEVRARFAAGVTEVAVTAFAAEAPPSWEPALDEEHVDHRWCTGSEAILLLQYPEPQDAVREAARRLHEGLT